jgi:hypothetical protein
MPPKKTPSRSQASKPEPDICYDARILLSISHPFLDIYDL